MASSSSGDKHFNLRLSTKHSSVSFTQHLTVLFFCFSISHMLLYGDWLTGSKKRARWLQARRIFSPSCPNLRIPNRFLREGAERTRLTVTDGDLCQIIFLGELVASFPLSSPSLRTLCAARPQWTSLCCRQRQPVRVWRLQPRLWGGRRVRQRRLPSFQGALAVSFCDSHLAAGPHRGLHAHRAGLHVRWGRTLVLFKGMLLTPGRTLSWCLYESLHLSLDSFRLSYWATGGTNAPKAM